MLLMCGEKLAKKKQKRRDELFSVEGAGVQQGRASRMRACYKRARRVRITQELTSGWRVLHLQRRAGSRPQIIAHASMLKRAEKTEERKRGADSRKEADLFLTDLLTLWLPPARNTLPSPAEVRADPRSIVRAEVTSVRYEKRGWNAWKGCCHAKGFHLWTHCNCLF